MRGRGGEGITKRKGHEEGEEQILGEEETRGKNKEWEQRVREKGGGGDGVNDWM
jgi:hypothetical protein